MTYRSDATLARVAQIRAAYRATQRQNAADVPLIDRCIPMSEVIAAGLREEVLEQRALNAVKIRENVAGYSKRERAAQTADHNARMAKLNARVAADRKKKRTTSNRTPSRTSNARRSRTGMIEQRDVVASWAWIDLP